MQTAAALVGADGAVELYAVAAVYLNVSVVVHPAYAEGDDALGLNDALGNAGLYVVGALVKNGLEAFQNLFYRLKKFLLVGIALDNFFIYAL